MTLINHALQYAHRGWSIIPIGKNKGPAIQRWKPYQKERPTEDDLRTWFTKPGVTGLAVICGPVSGDLVVRDIDKVESYQAWAKAQPGLAKTLPTVRTKRGYHVYFQSSVDRIVKFTDGELRGAGYVLLPPSRHPDGVDYEWVNRLPGGPLPKVDPQEAGLWPTVTERTEKTECNREDRDNRDNRELPSVFSVLSVTDLSVSEEVAGKIVEAIRETLPSDVEQRNRKVFEFARHLKAIPAIADAEPSSLRRIVKLWHQAALPNIGTKPFEDTWGEFLYGWPRVEFPMGEEPMQQILTKAKESKSPSVAMNYDAPETRLLVSVCRELQRATGDGPFYLSCRTAARLVGLGDHVTAWRRMKALVFDGVLELVEKGTQPRASRYRYVAKD